ncbi:hypothetical protein PUNSTDRAFT_47181 [Punctularia strigosozonata HHB-11173 SS5]|uniref:Uncharacterized protein n=1 Tax=Punctularia strigosozonata (strain HHB-11173) TaxID=741275 RepID=R7S509_PUNST|nr:uncharacterized protein PUNSTDRAFT_47181 [Punctularia strigosozonata HHB-11173 SS5]EIN04922.1 hypothetical protein PUNSTDRAFT_47181 [Punctularia strigosozonata HHB-11173 SS5]
MPYVQYVTTSPTQPDAVTHEEPEVAFNIPPPGIHNLTPVNGPALEDNPTDQMYDNWAGILSRTKTMLPTFHATYDVCDMDLEPGSSSDDSLLSNSEDESQWNDIHQSVINDIDEEFSVVEESEFEQWWPYPDKAKLVNLLVAPNLSRYPEDSGYQHGKSRQSDWWQHKVNPICSEPIARNDVGCDFFVEEPALANVDEFGILAVVMICWWFMRNGVLWAMVNPMRIHTDTREFVVNGTTQLERPLSAFSLFIVELRDPVPWDLTMLEKPEFPVDHLAMLEKENTYQILLPSGLSDVFPTGGCTTHKSKTLAQLEKQLERVLDRAPSTIDKMLTETGTKDKYLQHFVEKLLVECKKIEDKQATCPGLSGISKQDEIRLVLASLHEQMPKNILNPVLMVENFDPQQDSPVEILHVVLLWVVKYWWRDAVSHLSSKEKDILHAHINSIDTTGLGIKGPLGTTFVQYAGSLIAPQVLQGLEGIPDECYGVWLALTCLAPLLYQPEIMNLPEFMSQLEMAIFDFLITTALWNMQQFNKPKFYLFVHLSSHIR